MSTQLDGSKDWHDVFLVPGQLHDSERRFLRDFAELASRDHGGDITIVNIGIWRGASCHCLRIGAPDARLIGIDVMGWYPIEMENIHDETQSLKEFLRMDVIKRNSNYVRWGDPIHLLFIDGGHEYGVVTGDIYNFCPSVVIGGYVVFHDSGRDEVLQAIDDHIRSTGKWLELTKKVGTLAWFRRLE